MSTVPSKMQPGRESRPKVGETATVPETAIYGRMRQRIVAIGRTKASRKRVARDKYLRSLVHSGAITPDDLSSAIDGCTEALSELTWLTGVDDVVLGQADCVFLLNHGRLPVDDGDFRLNGNYYRICRCLQYDPHYYDPQLAQLPQALGAQGTGIRAGDVDLCARPGAPEDAVALPSVSQGRPATLQAARAKPSTGQRITVKRDKPWAFVGVLTVGLAAAPVLATMIVRSFPQVTMTTCLSIGGSWLALWIGALVLAWPRRR